MVMWWDDMVKGPSRWKWKSKWHVVLFFSALAALVAASCCVRAALWAWEEPSESSISRNQVHFNQSWPASQPAQLS
jgi:hypothetical protein